MTYRRTTFGELKAQVQSVAASLRASDLKPNSILCYYGPTSSASVILLLACSSIGAIWSSAAADFGPNGVLERFEQFVTPDAHFWGIVGVESVRYNGKTLDQRGKFDAVVEGIERKRAEVGAGGDSLNVVLVDYLREGKMQPMTKEGWSTWDDFVRTGEEKNEPLEFYQAPFDHPLWCLFSSGTTGKVSARAEHGLTAMIRALTAPHSPNRSFIAREACCCKARKSTSYTATWIRLQCISITRLQVAILDVSTFASERSLNPGSPLFSQDG